MSKDLKSPEHLSAKRLIHMRYGKVYNSVESLIHSLDTDPQLWAEERQAQPTPPQPTIEQIQDTVLAGTVINAARLVDEQAQAVNDENVAEKLAAVYRLHDDKEQDELAA